jgi:O-antigen biosynthesis protein
MWRGLSRRARRWLGALRGRYRRRLLLADLEPSANVLPLDDGSWCALDDDPCFRGPLRLPAGWYRWRVQLRVAQRSEDHCHGNARLFPDVGDGESEPLAMNLPFRAGKAAERYVHLEQPAWIRFDPVEYAGRFRIEDFILERVPSAPLAAVEDWVAYNQRLERPRAETPSYGRWLAEVEAPLREALRARAGCLLNDPERARELGSVVDVAGTDPRAWRAAIEAATGRWLLLREPGDTLSPDALLALADAERAYPDAGLIYSDHDCVDVDGFRVEPRFKPGWSPDFQTDADYIGPSCWFRRAWVLERLPAWPGGAPAALRRWLLAGFAEAFDAGAAGSVVRLPIVLHHVRCAEEAHAECAASRACPPVGGGGRWTLPEPPPLVSLLVPTRDGGAHLQRCVASLLRYRGRVPFEIILIDNQSRDPATLAFLDACVSSRQAGVAVRVLRHDAPFNFSLINNLAAEQAHGTVLGLLNDDVEATHAGWLDPLAARALAPAIGCVGPLLVYPDGGVQHAGVALGVGGVASHPHRGVPASAPGYAGWLRAERNVSVVTGAALFIRAALYRDLGGMDPELVVAYNDVDLCLKALECGYRNLYTPTARLLHHESLSRGDDRSAAKAARLEREAVILRRRWGARLAEDAYYNPNLSSTREDFTLDVTPCWRAQVAVARCRGLE